MTMTKTRRAKMRQARTRRPRTRREVPNPLPFLALVGVLEKGSARPIFEPWLREVLGERYLAPRARQMTAAEVRELWRPYMRPGEKLSDLLIAMREE